MASSLAWFPGANSGDLPTTKPFFWRRNALTWYVVARVNDHTYCLLGCANGDFGGLLEPAKQTNLTWTSTHTLVALQAGSTSFTLDFFSPISLDNFVRQSIPYSYLTVTVNNASPRDAIDVVTAIDQTWTAQNKTTASVSRGKNSLLFKLTGQNSIPRTELNDMATYGTIVLGTSTAGAASKSYYQSGDAQDIISQISRSGSLNSSDQYQSGQLVAVGNRLRSCGKSAKVTFAVGLERDPTILWLDQPQAAYYQSHFDKTEDVVDHFFNDEQAARAESDRLDAQVVSIGTSISSEYADILEASMRQM